MSSDEDSDDPIDIDVPSNETFRDGLAREGVEFLNKIKKLLSTEYDLDEDEKDAIDITFTKLAAFLVHSQHGRVINIEDLLKFGLQYQHLLYIIASVCLKLKISSPLALSVSDEGNPFGVAHLNSEDYDDDFEEDCDEGDDINININTNTNTTSEIYVGTEKNFSRQAGIKTISNSTGINDQRNSRFRNEYSDDEDPELEIIANTGRSDSYPIVRNQRDKVDASNNNIQRPRTTPSPVSRIKIDQNRNIDTAPAPLERIIESSSSSNVNMPFTSAGRGRGSNNINHSSMPNLMISKPRRKNKVVSWIADNKWVKGEKIGQGSFGEVFQGMNDKGKLFAVKVLNMAGKTSEVSSLSDEIELMRDLSHKNIVGYIGTMVDTINGVVSIFQEWVPGGSLAHLLKKFGTFRIEVVRNYTKQILLGLKYLHENGVVHRDIKGGNILVDDTGTVKLADFGASTKFDTMDGTQATMHIKGTPYFMAPEVLSENKYGRKGDIWAVGCTMIQMLTGEPPWKDQNVKSLIQLHSLLSSWNKGPPPFDKEVTPECRDCLNSCFMKKETSRPSAAELLETKFLSFDEFEESFQSVGSGDTHGHDGHGDGDDLDESGGMNKIREQLEQAVAHSASMSSFYDRTGNSNGNSATDASASTAANSNDDTMAAIDRKIQQRNANKSRQQQTGNIIESNVNSRPSTSALTVATTKNPYAKGAVSISKNIVEAASKYDQSPDISPSSVSSSYQEPLHVLTKPRVTVDTNFRRPNAAVPQLLSNPYAQGSQGQTQGRGSRLPSLPPSSSSSQSSARDSEGLTPYAEDDDSDYDTPSEINTYRNYTSTKGRIQDDDSYDSGGGGNCSDGRRVAGTSTSKQRYPLPVPAVKINPYTSQGQRQSDSSPYSSGSSSGRQPSSSSYASSQAGATATRVHSAPSTTAAQGAQSSGIGMSSNANRMGPPSTVHSSSFTSQQQRRGGGNSQSQYSEGEGTVDLHPVGKVTNNVQVKAASFTTGGRGHSNREVSTAPPIRSNSNNSNGNNNNNAGSGKASASATSDDFIWTCQNTRCNSVNDPRSKHYLGDTCSACAVRRGASGKRGDNEKLFLNGHQR